MSKPLKVFITYAHKNAEAKDKLITHLAILKQNELIDVWHDNEILPGDRWRDAIFNNLADSDILLYLTCPYSLARGLARLHLKEWEKAKSDLITVKNLGGNIIDSFRNDYKNVKDFEEKHNVKLPADIAALLTPP